MSRKDLKWLDGELNLWLGIEFAGKDCKMEDINDKSVIIWKYRNYTVVFKTFGKESDWNCFYHLRLSIYAMSRKTDFRKKNWPEKHNIRAETYRFKSLKFAIQIKY